MTGMRLRHSVHAFFGVLVLRFGSFSVLHFGSFSVLHSGSFSVLRSGSFSVLRSNSFSVLCSRWIAYCMTHLLSGNSSFSRACIRRVLSACVLYMVHIQRHMGHMYVAQLQL